MNEKFPKLIIRSLEFKTATQLINNIFSKMDFNILNFNHAITESFHQLRVSMWKVALEKKEFFEDSYIPKTWKDHFKRKYRTKRWLRWWVRRKPIKYFKIERVTIFPDVQLPDDRFRDQYVFYGGRVDETKKIL